MKPIPPSDFCRWAYPDVIQKSEFHLYLCYVERSGSISCFWDEKKEAFLNLITDKKVEPKLVMILPNDPSENDTKEP